VSWKCEWCDFVAKAPHGADKLATHVRREHHPTEPKAKFLLKSAKSNVLKVEFYRIPFLGSRVEKALTCARVTRSSSRVCFIARLRKCLSTESGVHQSELLDGARALLNRLTGDTPAPRRFTGKRKPPPAVRKHDILALAWPTVWRHAYTFRLRFVCTACLANQSTRSNLEQRPCGPTVRGAAARLRRQLDAAAASADVIAVRTARLALHALGHLLPVAAPELPAPPVVASLADVGTDGLRDAIDGKPHYGTAIISRVPVAASLLRDVFVFLASTGEVRALGAWRYADETVLDAWISLYPPSAFRLWLASKLVVRLITTWLPMTLASLVTFGRWAPRDLEFNSALQAGDLDGAWPVAQSSTKAPTVQSHKERCLRRLARRAAELSDLPRLVEDALSAAASLEASSVAFRVANWHKALQSNPQRMRQWIRRAPAADPRPLGDDPVHPLDIAAQVRVALLPKPDGGRRPLAVASALWRVLATVVVRKLRSWTLSWVPAELIGSVPGRSCADLHASFASDAHRARTSSLPMAGHKADVQRCFDSVSFDQAFEVARWLGAPPSLLALLKAFYSRQERHVAWQGVYHHSPVAPVLGLLQGCPFSPLLLNCVCSLWVRVVKAAEPRASLAVYLDDRTVWRVGRQASQVVVAAAGAGTTFDDFFGLRLHPEKLGSFATTARERAALQAEALVVGAVKTQFVLLGVPYTFGTTCLPDTAALTASVQRRCERVALAAASLPLRRSLVSELVLPLFAWAGPWTHFKQTHVDTWTRAVALALWGHKPPNSRSRLLLWHVVGRPRLHPAHALDWATVRQEWLRCSLPDAFRLGSATITPRWVALQRKWGWTSAPDGSWITALGVLRPGWDSLGCLRRVADYAFLQQVWTLDPKSSEHDLALSLPAFGPACRFVEGQDRRVLRTATACAADARLLSRLQHPPSADLLCCACEDPLPSRTHLTFECPTKPWPLERGARCERALLLRLLPLPLPRSLPRPLPEPQVDPEVVEALREAAAEGRVLCASDGGAFLRPQLEWWQRAAWAVAFEGSNSRTVFGGLVAGMDQSPHAAERAGLWQFLRHLHHADVPATLYLDNFALVLRLRRGLSLGIWSGSNPAFWHAVSRTIRRNLVVAWVPSHGKQAKWQALEPSQTALVRALNAAADARCSSALLQLRPDWDAAVVRFEQAEAWSVRALSAQHGVCDRFHELLRQCMGEWKLRQGSA
ncbi:unnamed protein product, partial [Symbiodinium sp. KB8]